MVDPVTIGAVVAVISAGTSVAATANAFQNTPVSVCCAIGVENWTKYLLDEPAVNAVGGEIQCPPSTILPSAREDMLAVKKQYSREGTWGTVSWLLNGKNRRVVVMWSAPYGRDTVNTLGLGITADGETQNEREWWDQIYYEKSVANLKYKIKRYADRVESLQIDDGDFEVSGTMGTNYKAEVKITIRPKKQEDLAESMRKQLEK